MRRSSPQLRHSARATLLALGALLGSDCVGTPLPEPPDELPRPEFTAFAGGPAISVGAPATDLGLSVDVRIAAQSGAVPAGSRVWAINLDAPGQAPVEQQATALGGFDLTISASDRQRVRLVARTARQHSAPLDLVVTRIPESPGMPAFGIVNPLGSTQLACLQVAPGETLRLSGKRGTLMLRNQCAGTVELERAALRLGDQGIALVSPPTTLAAGEQSVLTLTDSQAPGESERLDVLLLDVRGPGGLEGRYAIDVFSALE
jgi:hypothetical protein